MRTNNSIKNIITTVIMGSLTILIGFIAQRVFVHTLGLEYLGISGLFTNIVSMLGMIEMGLGTAIIYHLYKPISENNVTLVKSLLHFYKTSYRLVALAVTVIGLLIMPFIPYMVGDSSVRINIFVVYLLFLIDVVLTYLLAYKRSILYADQKNYIISFIHIGYTLTVNILQIIILLTTQNFYLYLFVKIGMHVIENLITNYMVNKRYPYLADGETIPLDKQNKDNVIRNVKAIFIHKFAGFVVLGSDSIIISIFLGIKTVGLYSSYLLVISGITYMILQLFASVTASIGNLLINSDHKKSFNTYKRVRFANFWLGSIGSIAFLVSMDSFVKVWLGEQYILPNGVLLALGINLYLQLTRAVTESFKDASGIFYQDRHIAIIESVVNIVFAIIFLQYFGLAGVFMGTICSNLLLHLYSYPKYAYTQLFKRSYKNYYLEFCEYLVIALVSGATAFVISRMIIVPGAVQQLVIDILISVIVPTMIIYGIYRNSDEMTYFKDLAQKLIANTNKLTPNMQGLYIRSKLMGRRLLLWNQK